MSVGEQFGDPEGVVVHEGFYLCHAGGFCEAYHDERAAGGIVEGS